MCDAMCGHGVPLQRGGRSRSPPRVISRAELQPPYLQDPDLRNLIRTTEVFATIEQEKHMSYQLPRPGSTAGRVLAHASEVFQSLMRRHSPMVFKFGITHCPRFRWYHKPWGYHHSIERFEKMIIVFASSSSVAPAYVEAALIDKFSSSPADHSGQRWKHEQDEVCAEHCKTMFLFAVPVLTYSSEIKLLSSGLQGCKNRLSGGDSSSKGFEGQGPFLTYIVYRSFKYPPPIPPLVQ